MNTICAGGAAVFNSLEHENILMLGLKVATNATYYRIQNEQGVLQFRYWIGANRHDYKKLLTFFNMQNNNTAVKNGEKILLQSIAENRKLFVPMLAKPFTL